MSNDKIDDILAMGASFDWIAPLYQWLAGYNHCHLATDDYFEAVVTRDALRKRGIDATLFIGGSGYCVVTKVPVEEVQMANVVDLPGLTIVKTESGPARLIRWLAGKTRRG